MLSPDSPLAFDAVELTAGEFNTVVRRRASNSGGYGELAPRPAVVAVMGHVDHGKTTLLDTLRKASVASGEAGGITQHIGAFVVHLAEVGSTLTFLDTPGHAAFGAMRARGARVTDLVVLVVAADDGEMAQTREALAHARAANVPIVVALTKCDKPGVDTARVRRELLAEDLFLEEVGGHVPVVEVSAKSGLGMDELQHQLHLQAELLELRSRMDCDAEAVTVESNVERGQGALATVLVTRGRLVVGDVVVVGGQWGRVRSMRDTTGAAVFEATPATPVVISGLRGTPNAGDTLQVVASEERARKLSELRSARAHDQRLSDRQVARAEARSRQAASDAEAGVASNTAAPVGKYGVSPEESALRELCVLVKADVDGTAEAVRVAVSALGSGAVGVTVLHAGVGPVTPSDVQLAEAAGAVICAFNVATPPAVAIDAKQKEVQVLTHRIIYHLLDEVGAMLLSRAPKRLVEEVKGLAEVLQVFDVKAKRNVATVAGCMVTSGSIDMAEKVRVLRDGEVVFEGKLASLRRHRLEVKQVGQKTECGLQFEDWTDFKQGEGRAYVHFVCML